MKDKVETEKCVFRGMETNLPVSTPIDLRKNYKVLVIGDGCKDVFRYGKCERICPEAPVPVFKPLRDKSNGGMAVNVYANIKALGVEADIITNSGATKTRYVDEVSNQMLLRVDERDHIQPVTAEIMEAIDFSQYDAVVISDYNKGFLSEEDVEFITKRHPLTFMDTKKKLESWCLKVSIIKINEKEYQKNGVFLFGNYFGDLVVTKGKDGAVLDYNEEFSITDEHDVRDLSGAGDTFLAALVAKYLEENNIREAIKFANKCASWVVTQKGVVVVDLNKIKL